MAIKYINVRENPEWRDDITETRYTFDDSGSYWQINESGLLMVEPNNHAVEICQSHNYVHFLAMMDLIGQEITMARLKQITNASQPNDELPF